MGIGGLPIPIYMVLLNRTTVVFQTALRSHKEKEMKRFTLFLLIAAALFVVPAAIFADDFIGENQATIDLSTTKTYQTCGPNVEILVYLDQDQDGFWDSNEPTKDRWRAFLRKVCTGSCSDGPWDLFDEARTGSSDGIYDSGSDSGKAFFKGLPLYTYYYVCALFPRDWLSMTEPTLDPFSSMAEEAQGDGFSLETLEGFTGWSNPEVSVVENPLPWAENPYSPNERNWDETPLCYKVKLKSTSNNVKVRFGVFTEDTVFNNPN